MATLFQRRLFLPLETKHICRQLIPNVWARPLATMASPKSYDAVIIGAGPGGLTAASTLLDEGLSICMIDPYFKAGRIQEKYREVPSNTKVKLFAQWATATQAFSKVIEEAPEKNPYAKMLTFDQDQGCMLGDAINIAQMLSDGLRQDERVDSIEGKATTLRHTEGHWVLPEHHITARKVVFAQGSHPRKPVGALKGMKKMANVEYIRLDTCLKPSELRTAVGKGSVVGVVGSSHSAVLAMKNLYEIEGVKIVNFYRSKLLYAEYKDDWILYDNTGLKGVAADWGKDVLENPPDPEKLRRVDIRESIKKHYGDEFAAYKEELAGCTHLIAAIGYRNNRMPDVTGVTGLEGNPIFDPHTGNFKFAENLGPIPGLHGVGIAYPETVTDKVGNVESAVGWFKFMKFMKRVVPEWTKST
jgi:thioredoxin reductase